MQNEFHSLIVELAGNETLILLWGMLRRLVEMATVSRVRGTVDSDREAAHEGARSHRRFVELVARREVDAAEKLWRKHLHETGMFLLSGPGAKTIIELLD
jgi:DNA-binding GntR family transcriptional regulator